MIAKPKFKVAKRLGSGVNASCQSEKFMLAESKHPRRMPKKPLSDYAKQLLEKQRLRACYGISERQLVRYVSEARAAQKPLEKLIARLELRLDNVVFRAGLTKTRRAARQMVSHGHIMLNGKKTTVPSALVSPKSVFSVCKKSTSRTLFSPEENASPARLPTWLLFERNTLAGSVTTSPTLEEAELPCNVSTVLEFYSR